MQITPDKQVGSEISVHTDEDKDKLLAGKYVPRFKKVRYAKSEFCKAQADAGPRIEVYAMSEGLRSGNPPFDQEMLDEHNLTNTNVNPLSFNATMKKAGQSYHAVHNTSRIAKFKLDVDGSPKGYEWGLILAEELQDVINEMPWFKKNRGILRSNLVNHGHGWVIFPDEKECRFYTASIDRVFVDSKSSCIVDEIKSIYSYTDYSFEELVNIWKKEKHIKNSPWQEGLEDFIMSILDANYDTFAANYSDKSLMGSLRTSPYAFEQALNRGDVYVGDVCKDTYSLSTIFQVENTGKVTVYMYADDWSEDDSDFLFRSDECYEKMSQLAMAFTLEPDVEGLYDSKGIAWKAYPLGEQIVQATCSLFDLFKMATTTFYKGAGGVNDVNEIRIYQGSLTNLPQNAEILPNNVANNMNACVETLKYLNAEFKNNLAMQGGLPEVGDGVEGSVTDKQALVKAHDEFGLLKLDIEHFQEQDDCLLQCFFARFLKLSKASKDYYLLKQYKDKCLKRGVPAIIFEHASPDKDYVHDYDLPPRIKIKTSRVAGDGSQVKAIASQDALKEYANGFSAKGLRRFTNNGIRLHGNEELVEAYTEGIDAGDNASASASFAQLENYTIQEGKKPLFSVDQEHIAHLSVHIPFGTDTLDALTQQQMKITDAYTIVAGVVEHSKPHLDAALGNPFTKDQVGTFIKAFKLLAQQVPLLKKNAEEFMKAQQEQQQKDAASTQTVMNEEQRKDLQVTGDERRKDFHVESTVERAKEANTTRAGIEQDAQANRNLTNQVKANAEGQARIIRAQGDAAAKEK